jgi:hypothetical protein
MGDLENKGKSQNQHQIKTMSIDKRDKSQDPTIVQATQNTVDPSINKRSLGEPSSAKSPVYGQIIAEQVQQRSPERQNSSNQESGMSFSGNQLPKAPRKNDYLQREMAAAIRAMVVKSKHQKIQDQASLTKEVAEEESIRNES